MKRLSVILLLCFAVNVSHAISTDKQLPLRVCAQSNMQQQTFTVTGYYCENGEYYKCRLRLKLVQSMYGQNSYIATAYAMDYFNGQWQWHSCNASCRYDAINEQYYVQVGFTTIYFDDPLEW